MKKFAIGLLVLGVAVCFAVPAMADFEMYGSIRVKTFYISGEEANTTYGDTVNTEDASTLVHTMQGNSRFGANASTADIAGKVELGLFSLEGGTSNDPNDVYTRLAYGKWDFGGGTLTVGQDYTPYFACTDSVSQDDCGMIGYGATYDGRQPQIRVNLENGFYAGIIRPNVPTPLENGADTRTNIPKIVVGYDVDLDTVKLGPGVAYNSYQEKDDSASWDNTIASYLVYLHGDAALGMADLKWNVHYGENLGQFGLSGREGTASAEQDGSDVENSKSWGGLLQVSFNVDPATIRLGYGYVQSENDIAGNDTDTQMNYFVNAKIPLAETFFITPEIAVYDKGDSAAGEEEKADEVWVGLQWRMDF